MEQTSHTTETEPQVLLGIPSYQVKWYRVVIFFPNWYWNLTNDMWHLTCDMLRKRLTSLINYLFKGRLRWLFLLAGVKKTLMMVLVQFWDHILTVTFVTFLLKVVPHFHYEHLYWFFEGYSVFGLVFYCTLNCKNRPYTKLSYPSEKNLVDQCTQTYDKKYQPTCLDVFEKNLHVIVWHVTCEIWWRVNILSKFQLPSFYGLG